MESVILSLGALCVTILGYALWRSRTRIQQITTKYAGIIDLDDELQRRRTAFDAALDADRLSIEQAKASAQQRLDDVEGEIRRSNERLAAARADASQKATELEARYEAAFARYTDLTHELGLLEENLEDISFGLYKPHFGFDTSEEYKAALERVRAEQRMLIKESRAATCGVEWSVAGSRKEGERMQKEYLKLMLRAFNGECDAAVANVSWNNALKMEERIHKSYDAVNDLGRVMQMSVTDSYLGAKVKELRLAHEYQEKRQAEREEHRKVREQIREEERAQREFDKAREEAEKEEGRYQKALEKARAEASAATGTQLQRLTDEIATFGAKLDEARRAKERAIARAQLTKSGFVYVISNIGSFGERVYKIGMTRRMEPMDRIYELGDASVPFPFDLHVMLYSDNAPELEGALHALFEGRRLNMVNRRKEFYRDVELTEIESFVRARGLSAQFISLPEAKEYRETVALLAERAEKAGATSTTPERFAPTLFERAAAQAAG